MEKILQAIEKKRKIGYSNNQLEVDYGYPNDEAEEEGYYLSKLNGWGATPITDVLALDNEVNDEELIVELDKMDIAHCF